MTPNLATFSKGMANGYAVSALVGRADVMDSLKESRFSSTFFTNTSEMAAAIKTIECIREKNVVPYIWKLGGKLMDGLREIIKVTGVEAEMIGVDIMPYIIFNYDNAKWISPTGFSGAPVFEPGGKWKRHGAPSMRKRRRAACCSIRTTTGTSECPTQSRISMRR